MLILLNLHHQFVDLSFKNDIIMILIADSGSTKTDWCLAENNDVKRRVVTQGINPFHQSREEIERVVREELKPGIVGCNIDAVFFYGSGCREELKPMMREVISVLNPDVNIIEVNGDLLGAARALCGVSCGIACILGTGANSCLYDGERIVANTPPLGYILGDEGSGAVLGKLFFNEMFKGNLPSEVIADYADTSGLTMADVIRKVYRGPLANRFLASVSPFVKKWIGCPEVHSLVVGNFKDFITRNIRQYGRTDLKINAVGSLAHHYQAQFEEAAHSLGYELGIVEQSPMGGLIRYHCG